MVLKQNRNRMMGGISMVLNRMMMNISVLGYAKRKLNSFFIFENLY